MLGIIAFVLVSLLIPELEQNWRQALQTVLAETLQARGLDAEQQTQAIQLVAQFMTGAFIALITLTHSITLLVGNWWYGLLAEPENNSNEFHLLRLGKVLSIGAILLGLAAMVTQSVYIVQLFGIASILFPHCFE